MTLQQSYTEIFFYFFIFFFFFVCVYIPTAGTQLGLQFRAIPSTSVDDFSTIRRYTENIETGDTE